LKKRSGKAIQLAQAMQADWQLIMLIQLRQQNILNTNFNYKTMKKQTAIAKLEKAGYRVTFTTSGNVIATKGQRSYTAKSVNALINQIF
jgi:hypothetical protein